MPSIASADPSEGASAPKGGFCDGRDRSRFTTKHFRVLISLAPTMWQRPLTRSRRYAPTPTSPRKRGEVAELARLRKAASHRLCVTQHADARIRRIERAHDDACAAEADHHHVAGTLQRMRLGALHDQQSALQRDKFARPVPAR